MNEHPCLPLDNNFLDVCRNCIIKLFKMPKFLVIFFLPPNTVFLLLIIIRQESAEAALNVRYITLFGETDGVTLSRLGCTWFSD